MPRAVGGWRLFLPGKESGQSLAELLSQGFDLFQPPGVGLAVRRSRGRPLAIITPLQPTFDLP